MNFDQAHTIALQALAFLMSEETLAVRFLGETGFNPADVRNNADAPEVLEAVLAVLVQDDSALLTFAANASLPPEHVMGAYELLSVGAGKRPLSYT